MCFRYLTLCFGAPVFVTVKNRGSLIGSVIILFKDNGCLPGVGGMWLFCSVVARIVRTPNY